MSSLKITVPVELTASDVKMLSQELNDTDNSEMSVFIEELLKRTDKVTEDFMNVADEIRRQNPFSQCHMEGESTIEFLRRTTK